MAAKGRSSRGGGQKSGGGGRKKSPKSPPHGKQGKSEQSKGNKKTSPKIQAIIERSKQRKKGNGTKREENENHRERVGKIQIYPEGFAFLLSGKPNEQDAFIRPSQKGTAMDGDTVKAVVREKSDGRFEARVVEVVKRKRERVVGTLMVEFDYAQVSPAGGGMPVRVFPQGLSGAKNGERVVVEITQWPHQRRPASGKVIEVLGPAGDAETELLVARRVHDVPEDFPEEILAQISIFPENPRESDLSNREDLRALNTFTIDPKDAKDFDDAVSVTKTGEDRWEIGVHIADVSHYIEETSLLDEEAYSRGTSVYLVDQVIPMLPEALSNGLCSLKPNQDRLTVSIFVTLDGRGEVMAYRYARSVIRSKRRFTYEEVDAILDGEMTMAEGEGNLLSDLNQMVCLAKERARIREERGSIDFDFDELKVHLDEKGEVAEVVALERTWSHRLIEEFMILANEVVAQHLTLAKLPTLYRIHDKPAEEKLTFFDEFLHPFGLSIKTGEEFNAFELQRVLKRIEGRPEENLIATVMLRSLKKAVYSPDNAGHFGLASGAYLHFTSPIRRYPDLIVHRLLTRWEEGWRPAPKAKERLYQRLSEQATHLSEREREAMEAERESIKLKLMQHVSKQIGEEFEGVVCGIQKWGFFVQLPIGLEGLVRTESLKGEYTYDEKRLCLRGPKRDQVITLGTPVRIKLVRLNPELRQVDFLLVKVNPVTDNG